MRGLGFGIAWCDITQYCGGIDSGSVVRANSRFPFDSFARLSLKAGSDKRAFRNDNDWGVIQQSISVQMEVDFDGHFNLDRVTILHPWLEAPSADRF